MRITSQSTCYVIQIPIKFIKMLSNSKQKSGKDFENTKRQKTSTSEKKVKNQWPHTNNA